MTTEERFWAKVDRRGPDECWPWRGAMRNLSPRDYGMFWLNGHYRPAHVVAWEMANGPMPAGMMGCHACDNPRCVNPAHVFPGTMSDNIRDAVSAEAVTLVIRAALAAQPAPVDYLAGKDRSMDEHSEA